MKKPVARTPPTPPRGEGNVEELSEGYCKNISSNKLITPKFQFPLHRRGVGVRPKKVKP